MTPLEVLVARNNVHLALVFYNGGLKVFDLRAADGGGLVGRVDAAGGYGAAGNFNGDGNAAPKAACGGRVGSALRVCFALCLCGRGNGGLLRLFGGRAGRNGKQQEQSKDQGNASFHADSSSWPPNVAGFNNIACYIYEENTKRVRKKKKSYSSSCSRLERMILSIRTSSFCSASERPAARMRSDSTISAAATGLSLASLSGKRG